MIEYSQLLAFVGILGVLGCQNAITEEQFWQQTNGPFGGRVTAISIGSDGKVYAGTSCGNVFLSTNKGETWEQVSLGTTHTDITAIEIAPDGDIYFSTNGDGIYRIGDSINIWHRKIEGLTSLKVYSLEVLPNGILIAVTKDGLFRSVNQSDNWTYVGALDARSITAIRIYEDDIYIIVDDARFLFSSDCGETWISIKKFKEISIASLAIGLQGELYAGTANGEIYHANSPQGRWNVLTSFRYKGPVTLLEITPRGTIFANLDGPSFAGDHAEFYFSRDGGISWNASEVANPWCFATTGDTMYIGTNEAIYRSDDQGTTWEPKISGIISQRVNDLVIDDNDVLFAGTYGGVFRSHDNGHNWTEMNDGLMDLGILDMAITSTGVLFAGTYLSSIFRSTDHGNTWTKNDTGIPGGRSGRDNNWILSLETNSRDEIFAATSNEGVFRSSDNGDSWTPVNNGLPNSTAFYAMTITPDDIVYVGNTKGEVFHSDNGGESWQEVEAENCIDEANLSDDDALISLEFDSEGRLYVGGAAIGIHVYSQQDHLWVSLNEGLAVPNIRSMVFGPNDVLFAGTIGSLDYRTFTAKSVFRSVDKGANWTLVNSGLHHARVKALAINSEGYVFAGTWGGGVYRSVQPISRQENTTD